MFPNYPVDCTEDHTYAQVGENKFTEADYRFYRAFAHQNAEGIRVLVEKRKSSNGKNKLQNVTQCNSTELQYGVWNLLNMHVPDGTAKTPSYYYDDGRSDLYMTVNTFIPGQKYEAKNYRNGKRISQYTGFFLDIDCHSRGIDWAQAGYLLGKKLEDEIEDGRWPECFFWNSGRGLGIYIFINPENPNNPVAVEQYNRTYYMLVEALKVLVESWGEDIYRPAEVDTSVMDKARLCRLPGSLNPKNKYRAHCFPKSSEHIYTLGELREFARISYTPPKSNKQPYRVNTTDEEILAWAKARYSSRMVAWAMTRFIERRDEYEEEVAYQSSHREKDADWRLTGLKRFLMTNPVTEGHRHTTMMALCSLYRMNGHTVNQSEVMTLNQTCFNPPLPEREVMQIIRWEDRKGSPFTNRGLYDACGFVPKFSQIPTSATPQVFNSVKEMAETLPPVASSKADRYMLGVLINNGIIPDTRIRNRRAIFERAQARAEKGARYDEACKLLKEGKSVHEVALQYGVCDSTIRAQARKRGLLAPVRALADIHARYDDMQADRDAGMSIREVAEKYGVNRSTVLRHTAGACKKAKLASMTPTERREMKKKATAKRRKAIKRSSKYRRKIRKQDNEFLKQTKKHEAELEKTRKKRVKAAEQRAKQHRKALRDEARQKRLRNPRQRPLFIKPVQGINGAQQSMSDILYKKRKETKTLFVKDLIAAGLVTI